MEGSQLVEYVLDEASELPFFWCNIDRLQCQRRLQMEDVNDGTYILRKSSGIDGVKGKILTLSVKKTFQGNVTTVWHFPITAIQKPPDIYYYMAVTQQRKTLLELFNYHRDNPLKGQNLPEACQLLEGLPLDNDFKFLTPDVKPRKFSGSLNYPVIIPSPPPRQPVPSPRCNRKLNSLTSAVRRPDIEPLMSRSVSQPAGLVNGGEDYYSFCHCGLPMYLTNLPSGWTVHRSKRDNSRGMLYFRDPYGQTSWQLHPDVDAQCKNRDYLNYGKLNVVNFMQYDVAYVDTSELKNYSNYQIWKPY